MTDAVMKWLTRDWHGSGSKDLTEQEVNDATEAYKKHSAAMREHLPAKLAVLAGEPDAHGHLSLHDARVEQWSLTPVGLVLRVLTPNHPAGWDRTNPWNYRRCTLTYRGNVELVGATSREAVAWMTDPETQLLYDEIEILPSGQFEHRHLLWPRGEFAVRFDDAEVCSEPVADRPR